MREAVWIPTHLRVAVDEACAELERVAPGYLGHGSSARLSILAVDRRIHSTTTLIQLSGNGMTKRFYLKTLVADEGNHLLKRSQIMTEHRLLEDLSRRFEPYGRLGVITPLRCWPEHLSMLTEEFPGEKLETVIGRAKIFRSPRVRKHVAELCGLVGTWLALFQTFTTRGAGDSVDLEAVLQYCERRLRVLREEPREGMGAGLARAVSTHLRWLAGEVDREELRPVGRQNDLRPDNILTDGRRIAVLDFTGFTYGPRVYDVLKFWMKLEDFKYGPFYSQRAVSRWQRAFLEGYGVPVDFSSPLCRLLRMANVLDKMSEQVVVDGRRASLGRRVLMDRRYQVHLRWLERTVRSACGSREERAAR